MRKIILKIDNHDDRMDVISALSKNGYSAGIKIDTRYLNPKPMVEITVEDWQVEDVYEADEYI